jgi:uncharacterized protein HemX
MPETAEALVKTVITQEQAQLTETATVNSEAMETPRQPGSGVFVALMFLLAAALLAISLNGHGQTPNCLQLM